jgi:hypothetical protein
MKILLHFCALYVSPYISSVNSESFDTHFVDFEDTLKYVCPQWHNINEWFCGTTFIYYNLTLGSSTVKMEAPYSSKASEKRYVLTF